jgi:glycosyltransferase involved in cell wall biosynthesis
MKLLILTQYFPPEMGAPQSRLFELAQELIKLGWDVSVITAKPNYPTGRIFEEYKRNAKRKREFVDGIFVQRVPLFPSKSSKILPRLVSYISFTISSLYAALIFQEKPDVVWVESPPLFIGITAMIYGRLKRLPYVFNVSDLWPDSFVNMGLLRENSVAFKLLKMLELVIYKRAWGVTGQSDGIIDAIKLAQNGIRTCLVTNGVNLNRFGVVYRSEELRKSLEWKGKTVFVYAGLHGLAQGLDQIIEAASRLRNIQDLYFVFFGDGPLKGSLVDRVRRERLENVKFYDPISRADIPRILASSDVAIIPLCSEINGAVPSKIYEAMASQLPILLVATGEPALRVSNAGAGISVAPGDIDGLCTQIRRLINSSSERAAFGTSGRRAAEDLYSREKTARILSGFLSEAMLSPTTSTTAEKE